MILAFHVICNMNELESQGTDVANRIGLIHAVGQWEMLCSWPQLDPHSQNVLVCAPKWQTS